MSPGPSVMLRAMSATRLCMSHPMLLKSSEKAGMEARPASPRQRRETPGRTFRPGESDERQPQCDEARTDSPFGIRVASTMSWVSLSGSAVMRLTTTMQTKLTGMPMIPNRRWSMPIHGSMPPQRTM